MVVQDKSDKASDEAYVEEVYLRHQAVVQHKKWANQQGYSMPFDTKVITFARTHANTLENSAHANTHTHTRLRSALV
jgi:hypothetical protein